MNSEKISTGKPGALARVLSVFFRLLVFVGIPFAIAFGALQAFEEDFRESGRQATLKGMAEALRKSIDSADPQKRFQRVFLELKRVPFPSRRFERMLRFLRSAYPKSISVFLSDGSGNPLSLKAFPNRQVFASRQFFHSLLDPSAKSKESLIKAIGGSLSSPRVLARNRGRLVTLNPGGARGLGGWWRLRDASGKPSGHLIGFVDPQGVKREDFLDQAIEVTASSSGDATGGRFTLGWFTPGNLPVLRPLKTLWPQGLASVISGIPIGEDSGFWEGRPFLIQPSAGGEIFFCLAGGGADRLLLFRLLRFLVCILGLIAGLSFLFSSLGKTSSPPGLRMKLIALLLVSGGTPLAVLMMTAFFDRGYRESLLIERIKKAQVARLTKLDQGMHSVLRGLEKRYAGFVRGFEKACGEGKVPDWSSLAAEMEPAGSAITHGLVVDRKGVVLFNGKSSSQSPIASQSLEVKRLLGFNLVQAYNGEYDQKPPSGDKLDMNQITGNSGMFFFESLSQNNLTIHPLNLLGQIVPTFLGYAFGGDSLAEGIFMIFHNRRTLQVRFLEKILSAGGGERTFRGGVLAIPREGNGDWPSFCPSSWRGNLELGRISELVSARGLPQHSLTRYLGRDFVLTGLQGNFLDGFQLFMIHPLDSIRNETRKLNTQLAVLSCVVLLLALLLSILTSRLILRPMKDLQDSLQAIGNRNFGCRLDPVLVREMDAVGERLNRVMEGLAELQVARKVQEHLWPSEGLSGPGWRIEGRCLTANDIGGDHHEWILLPDGRLLIVLGDVSGHGIPSALVEAAAKVFLTLLSSQGLDPAGILAGMNACFQDQIPKGFSMTCWIGIFDPSNRELVYANAGQAYPIAMVAGREPVMLESPGIPLGVWKKSRYKSESVSFAGGGKLVLYSDGLVEAENPGGERFSFSRLVALSGSAREEEAQEIVSRIFSEVSAWSDGAQPADDQTCVVFSVEGPGR